MIRPAYREDGDMQGYLSLWWIRANHSESPNFHGTLRVAMCNCEEAQDRFDIIVTQARETHCPYCSQLLETTPLLGITEGETEIIKGQEVGIPGSSRWIDSNSGKEFTANTQDTTKKEEKQSAPAPSQIPRW